MFSWNMLFLQYLVYLSYWYLDSSFSYDFGPVPFAADLREGFFDGAAADDARKQVTFEEETRDDGKSSSTQIRTDFPEMWLWSDYVAE